METNRDLIKCKFCSYTTRRTYNLRRHMEKDHNSEGIASDERCYGKDKGMNNTEIGRRKPKTGPGRASYKEEKDSYSIPSAEMEAWYTKENREDSRDEAGSITEQEFRAIGSELRATKCRILDGVLECIPDHMKAKARCICNILKRLELFFVNRHHEIIFEGEKLKGSNIHILIVEILLCCPRENIQPSRNESMTNSTKCTLKPHVQRIETRECESRKPKKPISKSQKPPRVTKFVSLFDGHNNEDDDPKKDSMDDGSVDEDDCVDEEETSNTEYEDDEEDDNDKEDYRHSNKKFKYETLY